jgi:hypothetical protein
MRHTTRVQIANQPGFERRCQPASQLFRGAASVPMFVCGRAIGSIIDAGACRARRRRRRSAHNFLRQMRGGPTNAVIANDKPKLRSQTPEGRPSWASAALCLVREHRLRSASSRRSHYKLRWQGADAQHFRATADTRWCRRKRDRPGPSCRNIFEEGFASGPNLLWKSTQTACPRTSRYGGREGNA